MAGPAVSLGRGERTNATTRKTVHWLQVLLAASILVPTLLFAVGAVEDRNLELKAAEDRVQKTVGILHEQARNVFRIHEVIIDELDDRIQWMSWDEIAQSKALHDYLAKLEQEVDVAQSVWLIDGTGHHRSNSEVFPAVPVDVSDRDYFKALSAADTGTVIGAPVVGKVTGAIAFTINRRRTAPDHRFDGVLSVAIAPSYFTDFYASTIQDASRAIILVRDDGVMLARDPPLPVGTYTYGPQSTLMQHLKEADEGVFAAVGEMDGVERVYAYRRIKGFPAVIVFGLGRDVVFHRWYQWLVLSGLFSAAASAGLFAVTWIALKRARSEDIAVARLHQEMERREAAERDREETENQLRQSQKMEAIGQLTGGIAHDFNNLLTVVIGNLDLVLPKMVADATISRRLTAAQAAAERGTNLTKQLLAFSRRQSLHPEIFDLRSGIGAITGLLESSLQGRIQIVTALAADLWPITVDREQLELAILNVAVNARDAMPDGGTLHIAGRNVALDGDSEDGICSAGGQFVAVTLTDTGHGIEPETLKRVFEPFFTTKDVGKGTGLGLSQVYGFAKQSGGKATISSVVGVGTAVTLYLPRACGTAAVPEMHTMSASSRACGTILLVEDEAPVAELAASILEERGFSVVHANDAAQALATVESGAAVDLVISDIVMPGAMNGIALGEELRRCRPDLPVLLTTGYSEAVKEAARSKFAILHKPYLPTALIAAVDQIFDTAPHAAGEASTLHGTARPSATAAST